MKLLLCSSYSTNPVFTQGGITIWAHNIMDYYHTLESNIQVDVMPFDRRRRKGGLTSRIIGGLFDYSAPVKETKNRLYKEKYDVIHLCTSASFSLVKDIRVLKHAKEQGVKTVVHFHFGRIPELLQNGNWEWKLLKRVMNLSDEIITIDMKSYESLKNEGWQNVHYLPNPLSKKVISQIEKDKGGISRNNKKLCFVGHVIPSKGVFEMCEACAGLDGIKLYVIGKATDEIKSKMLHLIGESQKVVFVGEVGHDEVIRELLSSGIFILPSYTEGFPNVILESMACGCAIATTNVGAIPEMLNIGTEEPCGLCCAPKDIESLRKNIQILLNNPAESRILAERSVKRVNEMYSVPIIWQQLERIWKI